MSDPTSGPTSGPGSVATVSLARLAAGWLAWAFRVALGLVFIVAGWPKLLHPDQFAWSIAHYHLVPQAAINLLAICLPWIELVCGAALVLGASIRANLLVIGGLLAIFIGAIASAMARDLDISCGCFSPGPDAAAMTRWTLYWDIIWLAMALFALGCDRGVLSLSGWWRRRRGRAAG